MAFKKQKEISFLSILVTSWILVTPVTATTNIDCRGKAFHCVNSTHFKICVDFGGVSKTVDDFLMPCPQSTVCMDSNYFECEYEITTARVITEQSDVTTESFPVTTTFWDEFNVTTSTDEQSRDLPKTSITSPPELEFVLPVTEKLEKITYTTNKYHEDIIMYRENMLFNTTFNETIESENNFGPSTIASNGTTVTYNKLSSISLPAEITYESFANTERVEGITTNIFKPIETATSASTKYSERLLSKSGVNIRLNNMQIHSNEKNSTPTSKIFGTVSTIFALTETQSDISNITGSTESYKENMKTTDVNLPVTSTANDIAQHLLVSNKNIKMRKNSTNAISSLAFSENLISTTESNNKPIFSVSTETMRSYNRENEIRVLRNNNLSLPVITETSLTTNIDGNNSSYIPHLSTSTNSNIGYVQYDTKFGDTNRPIMLTEFYKESPNIASNDKITPLTEINMYKMNETLSDELNKTSMLPSEDPYSDTLSLMTTKNTSFINIEKDLKLLKNTSIPISGNTVFIKDDATETPGNISHHNNLIHSYIDITHQETELEDKNLPTSLTTDMYEFHTKKGVLNENKEDLSMFKKRTRKNTVDVTTSSTLSDNLILTTYISKKPSFAVNISIMTMPNESTIFKNNNLLSVKPEYIITKNFVTDAPSDISNITSIVNSYTENTTQNKKLKDENVSITPITHVYDLFTNITEITSNNMTKNLSFNKNGIEGLFSNTTNVDFTTPIMYGSELLVTNAVNENTNNTVKILSQHKDIHLSSAIIHNYKINDQQITERILMNTLSHDSTKPYVSNVEQNSKRNTVNVHDTYNTTESATIPSTTINFYENKVRESSTNSNYPLITNEKEKVNAEQNKNNDDFLEQASHNNIIFTKSSSDRTLIKVDNVSQMNEIDSEFTTNIFGISSHTTSTVDYTESTDYKISPPTWDTLNHTVLDLLTRKYALKNNMSITDAKLGSKRTIKNTLLDSVNSNDSLITEIEASTSTIEVNTSLTAVTVGSQSTRPMPTESKNILHILIPDLNITPNVINNEREVKTARIISTTSTNKPAISFGNDINKNYSSNIRFLESFPVSDSNKLFSYDNSNVSRTNVERETGYLMSKSLKADKSTIFTNSLDLPITTERFSDKLSEKNKYLVNKTESFYTSAKTSTLGPEKKTSAFTYKSFNSDKILLETVTSESYGSFYRSLEINTTLGTEQKYTTNENIIEPIDVTTTKFGYTMSDINKTNLTVLYNRSMDFTTNVAQSDIKAIELENPSNILFTNFFQHAVQSDKADIKSSTNNLTLESYIGKILPNISSSKGSQSVTEKNEVINMNKQIKLTNFSAIESVNMNSVSFKNMSHNFVKHQDFLTVSSNYEINKNITASKLYSNVTMIPQVFDHNSNKLLNETSQDSNSSSNINNLELLEYGERIRQEDKDSLASTTQVENYSSFAITTGPRKITGNKDSINKLKYGENVNEQEQPYRSNVNNETKLSAETYVNPGNYSTNNFMSISEVHNTSIYSNTIIRCTNKNTSEACNKKSEDFTKLSLNNQNETNTFERSLQLAFNCDSRPRGKYSDKNNCKFFYLCVDKDQPIFGKCPNNTVFSEILKQCTKNLSHCVRDNKFQCQSVGRYIDVLSNQFYYICVKNSYGYLRFKLQCQKGYHLSKSKVKCVLDAENGSSSYEDSSNMEQNRKTFMSEPKEDIDSKNNKEIFECLEEGKFTYPDHCRKYYECKRVKSEFRRKIKKCDSNEVFDDDKKKCVDDDSYECI